MLEELFPIPDRFSPKERDRLIRTRRIIELTLIGVSKEQIARRLRSRVDIVEATLMEHDVQFNFDECVGKLLAEARHNDENRRIARGTRQIVIKESKIRKAIGRRLLRDRKQLPRNTKRIKIDDALDKFGPAPICYLTGLPLDYNDLASFQLDHVVPLSKGGLHTLENLECVSTRANQMKGNMALGEFVGICQLVVDKWKREHTDIDINNHSTSESHQQPP